MALPAREYLDRAPVSALLGGAKLADDFAARAPNARQRARAIEVGAMLRQRSAASGSGAQTRPRSLRRKRLSAYAGVVTEQSPDENSPELDDAALLEQMNYAFACLRRDDEQWQAFRAEVRLWEMAGAGPDLPPEGL